jgi:predicted phage replisome organizer
MAEKKRYWLKLDKDFLESPHMKVIKGMPNGKDYVLFYLSLMLKSIETVGHLRFSDLVPYNEEMLSSITDTNVDIVRSAVKIFCNLGLIQKLDDGTIFLTQVASMTGKETESAERVRLFRERQKQLPLQCNTGVTESNDNKEKQRTENREDKQEQKQEENISLQIENLRLKYDEIELKLIDSYFDILKWTRRNGKIAESVILKIYQEWDKFPKSKVLYALNLYISNSKYHDKRENYCYGIMRNSTSEEVSKNQNQNPQSKYEYL